MEASRSQGLQEPWGTLRICRAQAQGMGTPRGLRPLDTFQSPDTRVSQPPVQSAPRANSRTCLSLGTAVKEKAVCHIIPPGVGVGTCVSVCVCSVCVPVCVCCVCLCLCTVCMCVCVCLCVCVLCVSVCLCVHLPSQGPGIPAGAKRAGGMETNRPRTDEPCTHMYTPTHTQGLPRKAEEQRGPIAQAWPEPVGWGHTGICQ